MLSSKKDSPAGLVKLNLSQILPNSQQPRKKFDKGELNELALSIKSQGLLQPIIVRNINEGKYEIIAGERRWRAAQAAGIHEIECIVN